MFVLYANVCRLFAFVFLFFVRFFVFVFVGANEMHRQLMVRASCVCICFRPICLLKVNNYLFFVSFWHVLVFCLGTYVSCWMFFVVH